MNCTLNIRCFGKVPQPGTRKSVSRNLHYKIQEKTKRRERTKVFRRAMGERQWKVEGLFAEAKMHHGLDHARYRGISKVQIQAYMTAFVQNLKRLLELGLLSSSDLIVRIWTEFILYSKFLISTSKNQKFLALQQ